MIRDPGCTELLNAPVLVVDVGNTRVGIAIWQGQELKTPLSVPSDDEPAFEEAVRTHLAACPQERPAAVVISSVAPSVLDRVRASAGAALGRDPLIVGEMIPLPMDVAVEDAKSIGTDRACTAAAAYEKLKTACTVVDFGSAVTVDLVDDEGTLVGGAILPGLAMQLRSLHEYTGLLPKVTVGLPPLAYGRNTIEAMQTGVSRGVVGAVRALVEGYAKSLNCWPQVIATGGDVAFLAPQCDFLDILVSDLTLRGVGLAYSKYLEGMGG